MNKKRLILFFFISLIVANIWAENSSMLKHLAKMYVVEDNGFIKVETSRGLITTGKSQITFFEVFHGKDILLKAVPKENYTLKKWIVDGKEIDNKTNLLFLENITAEFFISAEFEFIEDKIEYNVLNDKGFLELKIENNKIDSGNIVSRNEKLYFTAIPQENYIVKHWLINGEIFDSQETTLIIHTTENTKVQVEFEEAHKIEFTVSEENGRIIAEVDNNLLETTINVAKGKNITFTAFPEENYTIKHWIINDEVIEITDESIEVFIEKDTFVSVVFEKIQYELHYEFNQEQGSLFVIFADTEITSGESMNIGENITFTATPEENYTIKHWIINDEVIEITDESIEVFIEKDTFVSVLFEKIQYELHYDFVEEEGSLFANLIDEEIPSGEKVIVDQTITLTATPEENYTIKHWIINDEVIEITDESIELIIEKDTFVSVLFEKIQYELHYDFVEEEGSLFANLIDKEIPSGEKIIVGQTIILTATPVDNYSIKHWIINDEIVEITDESIELIIEKDTFVSVLFEAILYTVNFEVTQGKGRISAEVNNQKIETETKIQQGLDITFKSKPNLFHKLKEWKINDEIQEHKDKNILISNLNEDIQLTIAYEYTKPFKINLIGGREISYPEARFYFGGNIGYYRYPIGIHFDILIPDDQKFIEINPFIHYNLKLPISKTKLNFSISPFTYLYSITDGLDSTLTFDWNKLKTGISYGENIILSTEIMTTFNFSFGLTGYYAVHFGIGFSF